MRTLDVAMTWQEKSTTILNRRYRSDLQSFGISAVGVFLASGMQANSNVPQAHLNARINFLLTGDSHAKVRAIVEAWKEEDVMWNLDGGTSQSTY